MIDLKKIEVRQNQASQEKEEQVAAAQTDKEGMTLMVTQLRNKVASLQVDLDNSVAVQNDFVRLSQSLQVELEKIRQAEKEVLDIFQFKKILVFDLHEGPLAT